MNDDFDKLLGDLREPEPEPARPAAGPPRKSRRAVLPWVIVGVVGLLVVGGAVAFAVTQLGGSDATAPVASDSPSPDASPSADPSPAPSPDASAGATLPAACVDIFSPAYHAELAATGAVLSEGNTGPREYPFEADVPAVVESTIAAAPHLECVWNIEGNYSVGISTVLAEVTDAEAAAIEQALADAGFTASSELGSTRYIQESPATEGFGRHGYSIIARDGILIATEWLDWPASGYTADIVNTVLGPAE